MIFKNVNNKLCVKASWLFGEGEILTKDNYDKLVTRKRLTVVQRGCRGQEAMVAYEPMPDRFKAEILKRIANPYEYVRNNELMSYMIEDDKAAKFYRDYRYGDDKPLPEDAQMEYYTNVKVVRAVLALKDRFLMSRKKVNNRKRSDIWVTLKDYVVRLDKCAVPHNLPLNVRRLQEKCSLFLKNGYVEFIHAGYGNSNKEKLSDTAKVWLLAQWGNNVKRITSEQHLLDVYNEHAAHQRECSGEDARLWAEIKSVTTIRNFLDMDGIKSLWWGARYGEQKAKEKFGYQHSTLLPTMRNSLWYSDGTKVNLYYLNDNGDMATLSVYEVIDVCSEVFVGYEFCKTENYEAQRVAFKRAFTFTGEKPYQLAFDNQGGHKRLQTEQFFSRLARVAVNTQPYNGKSKTIESAFGRFQRRFCKELWFFTGQNITAVSKESRANMEHILANVKKLPSEAEVKKAYLEAREKWNNALHYAYKEKGLTRMQVYEQKTNPEVGKISDVEMRDIFTVEHPNLVRITADGIGFTLDKRKYKYMVYTSDDMPDVRWIADHVDKKVVVKYDTDDMSKIYLYERTPTRGLRYLCSASTKMFIHRGLQEQEEWESSYIKRVEEEKKVLRVEKRDEMDAILAEHGLLPEQNGLNSPLIKGVETSKGAKKKKENVERKRIKTRTTSLAEMQKTVSNMVDSGDIEAIEDVREYVNRSTVAIVNEVKKKEKKSIYNKY